MILVLFLFVGEVQGYPDSSWSRNVSKSGAALYCLQKHNNSLIFEADFGYLSRVTMIGSEIRMTSLTYQNFKVNYSTDGLTWRTYFNGWNLTVLHLFHSLFFSRCAGYQ